MKWIVVWPDGPLAELARNYVPLWGTPAGDAVTQAMARVDLLLERNPTDAGESRAGHQRIMFESPLTLEYEVHAEQRVVIITRVRYTPPR